MNHQAKRFFYMIVDLFQLDKAIVFILLALGAINLLVQYSASDRNIAYLINDGIYLLISFVVLFIIGNLNPNHLKSMAIPIYILSIILLISVIFFGVSVNGAKRWLNIGIRIQPSELSKLAVPLMLTYYFSLKNQGITWLNYIAAFILLLIPFILIAKQPDLGTGILVLTSGCFVLFFAGISWRMIIAVICLFLFSTPIIWHFLHDYQRSRIFTLINPQSDPLGKGYHIIQGMIAIGSGGLWGKGYLHGTQTHLNFIPEKNTDFVITVLSEEFGYIGVCVILMLYIMLIFRCLNIAFSAEDIFSRVLAASITMSFMLYILINMGMVAGIFPVVGVPLPLISYGGTATIVLMAGFGILLAINRQNKY
jgi:rod shape determining protein RodA